MLAEANPAANRRRIVLDIGTTNRKTHLRPAILAPKRLSQLSRLG